MRKKKKNSMDSTDSLAVKHFLTPISTVSTASPEDTIEKALAGTQSSHDPVFVYNTAGRFLGLISTHALRYHHRFPPSTRVKHWRARINPPLITKQTPLPRVARFMLDTRLYTLPVFDESGKTIVGVISTPVILQKIAKQHPETFRILAERIQPGTPATIDTNASLRDVYHFLRDAGRSRVILVNEKGKIAGLISRRDVEEAFRIRTKKERFTSRARSSMWSQSYVEEEVPDAPIPAIEFAVTNPLTANERLENKKVIQQLIDHGKPSVILINKKRQPTGLISTHSILTAISAIPPQTGIPILFHHASIKSLGSFRVEKIRMMVQQSAQKIRGDSPVRRVEITIKEPKNKVRRTVMYDIKIRVFLWSGKWYIAHEKQYAQKAKHVGLEDGIRTALKEIQEQSRRDRKR